MSGFLAFVEKLLNGSKVEWKALSEVGDFQRGKRFVKDDMVDDGVPCIHYGEMYTHYGISAQRAKAFLNEDLARKLRVARPGDVVIVAAGETIEDIGNGTAWLGEDDVVIHDACFSFRSPLDAKYVSYFLRTPAFKSQIKKSVSSGKISSISAKGLGAAKIPIPHPDDQDKSLAIQREIVGILDKLAEHTEALSAALTAELAARGKQYDHYRARLLTFDEDKVEWKTLREIAHLQNAKPHERLVSPDGDVALLTARFISTKGKSARFVRKTDVLTPAITGDVALVMSDLPNGKALAKTFFVDASDRYAANQRVCLLRVKAPETFSSKFLYHIMNRNEQLLEYDNGIDQTHLKKDWILDVRVPVLPRLQQDEIVDTLDKLDTLNAGLSQCLSREIDLREKHYGWHRDVLFSYSTPKEWAA